MRGFARGWLLVVSVLNGFAGLVCGVLLVAKPDGSLLMATALLPVIRTLPLAGIFFTDMFWIGVAMLLALGVPNAVTALALFRRSERQYLFTLVAGVLLMLWTGFELMFMFNGAAAGYFLVGVVSAECSWVLLGQGQVATA
jgi:hypothetical protein